VNGIANQRAAAAANLIVAFDLVRLHSGLPTAARRTFGSVVAIRTGIGHPFYNPVMALDGSAVVDDVLAAVRWVESAGLPCSVQLSELVAGDVGVGLEAAGLRRDHEPTPVMVLDPITPSVAPPAGVTIRVGRGELFDAWQAAADWPRGREVLGPSLMADPSVRVAIAALEGDPVAVAAAIRSGSTLGVYAVGTAERARRRGLGRAVTSAVIDAGVDAWGSRLAVLQSSQMGHGVYRSMGFVDIDHYTEFARPSS